jgi:hypothetical protein
VPDWQQLPNWHKTMEANYNGPFRVTGDYWNPFSTGTEGPATVEGDEALLEWAVGAVTPTPCHPYLGSCSSSDDSVLVVIGGSSCNDSNVSDDDFCVGSLPSDTGFM